MSDNETIEKRLSRLYRPTRIAAVFIRKILYDIENCGLGKITAVFGPYSDDGRAIIEEICQFIAEEGFCAITLDGFYHPSDPNNMQSIDRLLPPVVRLIFRPLQSMYVRILPRVACRVVVNVTDIRTNLIEWDESFLLGRPLFTLLLAEVLSLGEVQDCEYLYKDPSDTWVECTSPSSEFCTGKKFCPFDELPWIIRQGTMDNRPRCCLVGSRTLEGIKIPLHDFSVPFEQTLNSAT